MLAAWAAGSLAWLYADRLVRDGDEEGHVGAAELLLQHLWTGDWGRFLHDAWRGDLGEYPPLFPALVALAWRAAGGGLPGRPAVRGVALLGLALAALSSSALARRLAPREGRDRAGLAALAVVLTLPLANGLARHFMPEGLLVGAVALSVLAAERAGARPGPGRAALLGLALGAGLLVKQTFVLLAAPPVAWAAGRRLGRWWGVAAAVALAVAGPWTAGHLTAQLDYLGRSAAPNSSAPAGLALAYYPLVLAWTGLGPAWTLLALASAVLLWRRRERRALGLGAAWLLGGMLVLAAVPKKYPRLIAPATPGATLWVAAAAARLPPPALAASALAGAGWLAAASLVRVPPPAPVRAFHERCIQEWIRPPVDDDLGLSAVAAAVRDLPPGPVAVLGGPAIPCRVQTTHDWAEHLGPYLRRSGDDRGVIALPAGGAAPPSAGAVVDFTGGPGLRVPVPLLGVEARVRPAR